MVEISFEDMNARLEKVYASHTLRLTFHAHRKEIPPVPPLDAMSYLTFSRLTEEDGTVSLDNLLLGYIQGYLQSCGVE